MVQRNKVLIGGSLPGGEEWSVGITYIPAAGTPVSYVTTQADLNTWAADIASLFSGATLSGLQAALSTSGQVRSVIAQKFANDNTLERQSVTVDPAWSGTTAIRCPLQTAIVVSLLTGTPGASYRGRFYWPGIGAVVDTGGKISSVTASTTIALNAKSLLDGIANAAPVGGPARPAIFSTTKNILTPVSQIRVGDVPDTQRRRRDNLVENYSVQAYP